MPDLHLTYCTNIHPAVGWEAVLESLRAHAPALKARLSPDAPFGIGLRLSGAESASCSPTAMLADFRAWLDAEGLYVFTINGFPHGTFHGAAGQGRRARARTGGPRSASRTRCGWPRSSARCCPTASTGRSPPTRCRMARGSTTTALAAATRNMVRVGDELRGTRIALAIEPEADGALADVDDLIAWWPDALDATRSCFDACHSAVAYEEPDEALDALDAAGIRVGKAQLSAALTVLRGARARSCGAFADPIYLHQVTERRLGAHVARPPGGAGRRTAAATSGACTSTCRSSSSATARWSRRRTICARCIERVQTAHLEIETYTWDVLPAGLKASSVDSIAREYEWVLDVLRLSPTGCSSARGLEHADDGVEHGRRRRAGRRRPPRPARSPWSPWRSRCSTRPG